MRKMLLAQRLAEPEQVVSDVCLRDVFFIHESSDLVEQKNNEIEDLYLWLK